MSTNIGNNTKNICNHESANMMNHTGANINCDNSIETHGLSKLTAMLMLVVI